MSPTDRTLALLGQRIAEAEINAAQYQALFEETAKQLEDTRSALTEANKLAGQLEAAQNELENTKAKLTQALSRLEKQSKTKRGKP